MVQSYLNSDDTRTFVKYDEKRMLNEFARYIAKKEQPMSMTYCTDFARLVIRDCDQPLYKRLHHNKMISELKNNMLNEKVNYLPYLQL
jgi:inhibitor of KinA sporulation pathway (predicted exonuclease)